MATTQVSGVKRMRPDVTKPNTINIMQLVDQRKEAIYVLSKLLGEANEVSPDTMSPNKASKRFKPYVFGGRTLDSESTPVSFVHNTALKGLIGKPFVSSSKTSSAHITPRFCRRRTNSHRRYRLPQALRLRTINRNANKPDALRSRYHRRKPALLRKKWDEDRTVWYADVQKVLDGSSKTFSPPAPRRSPLHLWHAKRLHMKKEWNTVYPNHRNDIGVPAAVKRVNGSFVVFEDSTSVCFSVESNTQANIASLLQIMTDPSDPVVGRRNPRAWSATTEDLSKSQQARIRRGAAKFAAKRECYEYDTILCKLGKFPDDVICAAQVTWWTNAAGVHGINVWVPAAASAVIAEQLHVAVQDVDKCMRVRVVPELSRVCIAGNANVLESMLRKLGISTPDYERQMAATLPDPRVAAKPPTFSRTEYTGYADSLSRTSVEHIRTIFPADSDVRSHKAATIKKCLSLAVDLPPQEASKSNKSNDTEDFLSLNPVKPSAAESEKVPSIQCLPLPMLLTCRKYNDTHVRIHVVLPTFALRAVWQLFPRRSVIGLQEWRHCSAFLGMPTFPFDYPEVVRSTSDAFTDMLKSRSEDGETTGMLVVRQKNYAKDVIATPITSSMINGEIPKEFDTPTLIPMQIVFAERSNVHSDHLLYMLCSEDVKLLQQMWTSTNTNTSPSTMDILQSKATVMRPSAPLMVCGRLTTAGSSFTATRSYGLGFVIAEALCALQSSMEWQTCASALSTASSTQSSIAFNAALRYTRATEVFPFWAMKEGGTVPSLVFLQLL